MAASSAESLKIAKTEEQLACGQLVGFRFEGREEIHTIEIDREFFRARGGGFLLWLRG